MAVKIITDSTSYINKKLKEKLDIKVLSLYVSFEDESIRELEIENKQFYEKMEKKGVPVSSQPAVGEIYKAMVDVVSKGDDLVCVFLSSDMSGTYNSACAVKEKVLEKYKDAKIHIVDSRSNSMELGFAAIIAAREAKVGKSFEEIVEKTENNIKKSRFIFIPDNLEYLKKGGRIGGAGALLGNILKIIPVLTVKDGKTSIVKTIRTKRKAIKSMLDLVIEDHKKYTIEEIVVHNINCYDEALKLSKEIIDKIDIRADIVDIGPVIGMHVGPGAMGIAYYTKKEIQK